jgi:hypothetical protein
MTHVELQKVWSPIKAEVDKRRGWILNTREMDTLPGYRTDV